MLKRIVVSLIALGTLLTCFLLYVSVFGHFSRLEPLGPELLPPGTSNDLPWAQTPPTNNHAKDVARKVWGEKAWQVGDDVVTLYWLQSGVIVYIKDYEREGPETWRLTPFSLVYSESSDSARGATQLVTLTGQEATLVFDRPVDLIRMSGARPIGGKISGNVQVQSDRATETPLDDLVAYTQYLEFRDDERKVWTESPVRIISGDAVMTGTGAEMHLAFTEPGRGGNESPQFQGVNSVLLHKDVQLNMLTAASGGLMPAESSSARSTLPRGSRPSKEQRKTPVQITCRGPFRFDVEKNEAQFHDNVMMDHQTGETQHDRLFSDELIVLFERTNGEEGVADGESPEFEFRQARASGRAVRVLSDAQAIEAIGSEMTYDAVAAETILRGDPDVVATKEGNVLHGRELKFTAGENGKQFAEAIGEGSLEVRDPAGDLRLVARWSEWARISPQGDQGKQQLLVLHGTAQVDQPGRGTFQADRINVWLEPNESPRNPGDRHEVAEPKWSPARIEGVGSVRAESEEFLLEAATRLDMLFDDAPASGSEGNMAGTGAWTDKSHKTAAQDARPTDPALAAEYAGSTPKKPAHLRADLVKIKILRIGSRSEVSQVETEGHVDFLQPANEQGEDEVVVRGDALNLHRVGQQYHLEVIGRPAHVELNSLKVDGARVKIDQPIGVALVDGKGWMVLMSDTSFEGKKLDTPAELTIQWGTNMFFDGAVAYFDGGVVARQGTSRLRCHSLEAKLSERMDISSPRKEGTSRAKISELTCTDYVELDNVEYRDNELEKYEHLEARKLIFSNETGRMTAQGPGLVRTYTRGSANLSAMTAQSAATAAASRSEAGHDNQLLLTQVRFANLLEGARPQQIVEFYGHVEVIRSPVNDENEIVNPDQLPNNGMRIACGKLEMATKRGPEDHPYNVMVATENVSVEADVFSGRGDRVSYNQLHERIVFESRSGSFATFYRQSQRGQRPDETRAFKIRYDLRTGDVKVEGGVMVDFQEREADRKNMGPKRY